MYMYNYLCPGMNTKNANTGKLYFLLQRNTSESQSFLLRNNGLQSVLWNDQATDA